MDEKDPIVFMKRSLKKEGVLSDKEIKKIKADTLKEVQDAVVFARASAMPDVSEMYKDILA